MLNKVFANQLGLKLAANLRAFSATPKTNQHYIDKDLKYVCHNYGPLPVVVEKAERIYVWDVEGKRYMDFLCGYSSTN